MIRLKKIIACLGLVFMGVGLCYTPVHGNRGGENIPDENVIAALFARADGLLPSSGLKGVISRSAACRAADSTPRGQRLAARNARKEERAQGRREPMAPVVVTTLDLSNQDVPLLPDRLPTELEELNAAGNDFGPVPQWVLAAPLFGCPRLRKVDYSRCGLEGNLMVPHSVEELILDGNDLSQQEAVFAQDAGDVPAYDFADINEFREAWKADQSNPWVLRRLSLRDCGLTDLPEGLPASLQEIDLTGNALQVTAAEVDHLIASMPNLCILRLDWSAVQGLVTYSWGQHALQVMAASVEKLEIRKKDLSGMQVQLWDLVAGLAALRELDLSYCHLSSLPAGLPAGLEKLCLGGNNLGQVQARLWALVAGHQVLRELVLRDCNLTSPPAALPAALEKLDLEKNNRLGQVGEWTGDWAWAAIAGHPALRELNLRICGIRNLPAALPASLEKLGLDRNDLSHHQARLWALVGGLPALRELNLWGCRLSSLPAALSVRIEKLNLGENNFAQLQAQLWALVGGLTVLRELNLRDCGLRSLPAALPAGLECLQLLLNEFDQEALAAWRAGLPAGLDITI